MAKQMTEDELSIRRKARRRLIGAIALTLAVVVILPMVFDSEPKSGKQDIELRIPAPDKVGEFVPGVAPAEVAGVSPFAEPAKDAALPPVPPAAEGGAGEPPAQPAASKTPEPSVKNGKPAVSDGFVAQVGAYSNAAAAKQELDRLKKWGFKAYTEKVGDKVRVRAGPYAGRDEAEKARKQLEQRGLNPVVMSIR